MKCSGLLLPALFTKMSNRDIFLRIFWPLAKIFHPSSQGPGPGPGPGPVKKDGKCVFFQTGFRAVMEAALAADLITA